MSDEHGSEDRHAPVDEQAAARRRRLLLVLYVLIMLLAAAGGVTLAVFVPSKGHQAGEVDFGAVLAVLGVMVVVLVPAVWVLSRRLRSEHFNTLLSHPMKRRSRVAKALRKGQSIAAEDMPVAHAIVGAQRLRPWIPWAVVSAVVVQLVNIFVVPGFLRWIVLGTVALEAVAFGFYWWLRRRLARNYERAVAAHQRPDDTGP